MGVDQKNFFRVGSSPSLPTPLPRYDSKQEFINHALKSHPESKTNLSKVCDGSLQDIHWPFDHVIDPLDTSSKSESETQLKLLLPKCSIELRKLNFLHYCKICSEYFDSKRSLKNHGNLHHDNSNQQIELSTDNNMVKLSFPVLNDIMTKPQGDKSSSVVVLKNKTEEYFEEIIDQHEKYQEDTFAEYHENVPESEASSNHIKSDLALESQSSGIFLSEADPEHNSSNHEPEILEEQNNHEQKVEMSSNLWKFGKCKECRMDFRSFKSSQDHEMHCKTLQDKICEHCQHQFDDIAKLKLHRYEEHKPVEDLSCPHCFRVFPNKSKLNEHIKGNHSTKNWECDICSQQFTKYNSMTAHKKYTHELCRKCEQRFSSHQELEEHKKNCDAKATCHICGFSSSSKKGLRVHIKNVHEDTKCKYCGEKFEDKFKLTKHINEKHGGLDRKHQCDTCGHAFQTTNGLNQHIISVHNKLRDFICCFKANVS